MDEHDIADVAGEESSLTDPISGCDNADLHFQLELDEATECSSLTMRLRSWAHSDGSDDYADDGCDDPPVDVYADDDGWINLARPELVALRDRLAAVVDHLDAHDQALMADDDTDGM